MVSPINGRARFSANGREGNQVLFDTAEFFVFLTVTFICYAAVHSPLLRRGILLAASYIFYLSFSVQNALLLFSSTIVSYAVSKLIAGARREAMKKVYAALGASCVLAPLFFFKYWNFLDESLFAVLPGHMILPVHSLALPIGISFFTFNMLSYIIDTFKGRIEEQHTFSDYLLYVSFFPSLLAGPLMRGGQFFPQLRSGLMVRSNTAWEGVVLVVIGCAKKALVSDNLAVFVNSVFDHPGGASGPQLLLGGYAYTVQIYCDFSGYTDMARGIALLFGLTLPLNFNSPYLAKNPSDFWSRWHMTLSSWFKDYVYIPLGGNRRGTVRTGFNLFLVMFLCGLWHGASWHFVLWGIYHGLLLIMYRYASLGLEKLKPYWTRFAPDGMAWLKPFRDAVSVLVMLHLVIIGWILFRADSVSGFFEYMKRMMTLSNYHLSGPLSQQYSVTALLVLLFAAGTVLPSTVKVKDLLTRNRYNPYAMSAMLALIFITIAFRVDQTVQFIYFQF